jgi:hypothetical protein
MIIYTYRMTIETTIDIQPNRRLELELPLELPIGRARVELTITPEKAVFPVDGKSAFGCLSRFACPTKISGEKEAWASAALEKHAKN